MPCFDKIQFEFSRKTHFTLMSKLSTNIIRCSDVCNVNYYIYMAHFFALTSKSLLSTYIKRRHIRFGKISNLKAHNAVNIDTKALWCVLPSPQIRPRRHPRNEKGCAFKNPPTAPRWTGSKRNSEGVATAVERFGTPNIIRKCKRGESYGGADICFIDDGTCFSLRLSAAVGRGMPSSVSGPVDLSHLVGDPRDLE